MTPTLLSRRDDRPALAANNTVFLDEGDEFEGGHDDLLGTLTI